ncbi:MAG: hypothetical protein AAF215_22125 [Cyanobacteria bacterium P01_A01_bin.123]
MLRSTLSQISFVLASAVAITSIQAMPGIAQSVPSIQRSERMQVVELESLGQSGQPSRESTVNTPFLPAGGGVINGNGCPEGTHLVMFDQPIYDEEGLFVVGYEPVPYCIDDDLEPAG